VVVVWWTIHHHRGRWQWQTAARSVGRQCTAKGGGVAGSVNAEHVYAKPCPAKRRVC